jgi:hypothetical protein
MLLILSLGHPHAATPDLANLKKLSDCTHQQLLHEVVQQAFNNSTTGRWPKWDLLQSGIWARVHTGESISDIQDVVCLRSYALTLWNHRLYCETVARLHDTHRFIFWKRERKKSKQSSVSTNTKWSLKFRSLNCNDCNHLEKTITHKASESCNDLLDERQWRHYCVSLE